MRSIRSWPDNFLVLHCSAESCKCDLKFSPQADVNRKQYQNICHSYILLSTSGLILYLKGQSHEKVGEMRVQGDSLDPN
jgi:hypothetical protein